MTFIDDGRFVVLAAEREKRGLTQRDICDLTRIPLQHLDALEQGAFDKVPDGPYVDAYYRDYCRALGLKPLSGAMGDRTAPSSGAKTKPVVPLWAVRLVAMGSACLMLGWFAYQTMSGPVGKGGSAAVPAAETEAAIGDQVLKLHVRKTGRFLVSVDDKVVLDDAVEEGARMTFVGQRSIEVLLPGVGYVNLDYNGRAIVPQGLQNQPRKLVFLDDTEDGDDE